MAQAQIAELQKPSGRISIPQSLAEIAGRDEIDPHVEAAWSSLKPTLTRIVQQLEAKRVLEIGGGRHPFFGPDEAKALNFALSVNDIEEGELRHSSGDFEHFIFDVAGDISHSPIERGSFDLVFSRMVFEHVRDGRKAWTNLYDLLAPGGVGFAFVPTLFSPPFVINRLFPEALTGRLVRALDRRRNPNDIPKFPAYYSQCRADEAALRPMLKTIGFRETCTIPFFGTPYFPAVPGLKGITRAFDRLVEKQDLRMFASYAYIMARK